MGMTAKLFETAPEVSSPWYVARTDSDTGAKTLAIRVDFTAGSRFGLAGVEGQHPVHDTVAKRYRHLNFFQHECFLEVRVPRVKLPDGSVHLVEPPWAGKTSEFTLLFAAPVLMLCQQMTFAAAARLVGESRHRVAAICERYIELALAHAELSAVRELANDETSRARGHDCISLAADALERLVLAVAEGRSADSIGELVRESESRGSAAAQIRSVSIDMSPAFIKRCDEYPPNARITFAKLHVIRYANAAVDRTRRIEQRTDPSLKSLRWSLLKDRSRLSAAAMADLDALIAHLDTLRTTRACSY
jgi:transposase